MINLNAELCLLDKCAETTLFEVKSVVDRQTKYLDSLYPSGRIRIRASNHGGYLTYHDTKVQFSRTNDIES
jgi:hypothetical protein